MNLEQEVAILRRVPLFAGIDNAKLKLMAFASERMDFKPGQALCRQGEPGDCAYIILSGQAAVTIDTDNGPLQVAEVGANEIVGEIAILIDVPRTATVAATSDVSTLRITKDLFFRLIRDFPEIGIQVMRVLATRLERLTARVRGLGG